MFTGMSMEIVSVFVDYDDDNRITFNLLNGETVVQPRPPEDTDRNAIVNVLNSSQNTTYLEDLRLWNVVKAHWQSQLSVWPGLVHTWVHFHFNDLVCSLRIAFCVEIPCQFVLVLYCSCSQHFVYEFAATTISVVTYSAYLQSVFSDGAL